MTKDEFLKELSKLIDRYETNDGDNLELTVGCYIIMDVLNPKHIETWYWNGEKFVLEKNYR